MCIGHRIVKILYNREVWSEEGWELRREGNGVLDTPVSVRSNESSEVMFVRGVCAYVCVVCAHMCGVCSHVCGVCSRVCGYQVPLQPKYEKGRSFHYKHHWEIKVTESQSAVRHFFTRAPLPPRSTNMASANTEFSPIYFLLLFLQVTSRHNKKRIKRNLHYCTLFQCLFCSYNGFFEGEMSALTNPII